MKFQISRLIGFKVGIFRISPINIGEMSLVVRKPAFCICENKDTDVDQRLCFRYTDSTIPLLPNYEISSL